MSKILRKIFKIFKLFISIILIITAICAVIVMIKFGPSIKEGISDSKEVIENSTKEDFLTNETTYIFNDNNRILKKLTLEQDSEYLLYEDIPRNVVNAFVAVEDRNFWNHNGIDLKGIMRVLYRYAITKGDEKHGASTITQQVARRTFLSFDVSMDRKIKEIFYAIALENKYTKEEIMEFYVNDIYYANNCYGISSASKFYFNKPVKELSLSQIAYLCAIPNAPTYYDPLIDKDRAITRRDKILKDMLECNYITKRDYEEAINEEIELDLSGNIIEFSDYQTTYAIKCAVEYFMELDGFNFRYEYEDDNDYKEYLKEYNEEYKKAYDDLSKGGYKVYTSLNDEKQNTLQTAIDDELSFDKTLSENNIYSLQSAATLIDNKTNKVVAIVGGRTQNDNEEEQVLDDEEQIDNSEESKNIYSLNRAFQSYRQPGSSIKPIIVYTPGLEKGFTPNSTVYSLNVKEVQKQGTDISSLTGTPFSYRSAVEQSDNGCAMYVYYCVSPRIGINYIMKMGFNKIVPDDYYMAAGLGGLTYGVTTEEMAGAYSTLVNGGYHKKPTCITSIIDRNGNEIYKEAEAVKIYDSKAATNMLDILKGVITNGTARSSVKWNKNIDIAGKTGTTNDNKDGWFCGVSPYYTLSVWVGNDTPKTVKGLQGGTYPTKIWSNVMNEIHTGLDDAKFEKYDERSSLENSQDYYSYLPGRDDEEVLSDGYTVKDYRLDRVIGSNVQSYINKLNDMAQIANQEDLTYAQNLYNEASALINTIYSINYKEEMTNALNEAYYNIVP